MAGSLYLGSQRVCPAIVIGGGSDINVGLEVDQDGILQRQQSGSIVFSGFTDVGYKALYSFCSNSDIVSADLSNLKSITDKSACAFLFSNCYYLESVNLSNLELLGGFEGYYAMFSNCTSLKSIDLSSVKTISSFFNSACSMFSGCTSLISVDLSGVEIIRGQNVCNGMFSGCTSLKSLSFQSLKTIEGLGWQRAFNNIISGCSDVTMHFPSNMESTVQSLRSYPNFGGTNTTLLFDLPATA